MSASASRLPSIYFEKLLESSPDIVVAVDRQGTIIFYNDGARQTLGYASAEVLGQHVTRLYPDIAEARKVMAALRAGKNAETVFVDKAGTHLPVVIAGSIIRDAGQQELGTIGFAKDLREIRRRDRLATLGEVAVGLAHEINNPLEVIVNNLNLIEAHVAKVSSDDEFVVESERMESVHAAIDRIQRILGKLQELAQGAEYATTDYLPGTKMTDLRVGGCPPAPGLCGRRIAGCSSGGSPRRLCAAGRPPPGPGADGWAGGGGRCGHRLAPPAPRPRARGPPPPPPPHPPGGPRAPAPPPPAGSTSPPR
jgi:PAS domain S-box-containing protein